ncbi:IS3 family transposase [Stenotrophomonas maltophilia]|nr:IS3 family transposase [Stenotrophomonas maltophilia]
MSRITRRSYTDEFKHQAVELAESLGPAAAARQLEMSVKTLANWLDAVRAGRSLTSEARRPATDLESEISRLRAENANLKMEREILKKSGGVLCQRVQVRYAFVASQRTHYPTRLLCRVLGVSVSGFHDYLRRQCAQTCDVDSALRTELRAIHVTSKRSYGRRRLVRALRARNHPVGHKRVARLMAEERIQGKTKGRFRPQSSGGSSQLAPNLLDRQFAPGTGPTAWVGDITYVPTRQGWLHLAVVISVQTRQVLGYSVSKRLTEELVVKAFANAWALHPQRPGLIFHSDRGGQYWGNEFRQLLQSHGVVQSMSRPGNCWDNAVAESFFATFKTEEAAEPYASREQASQSIAAYIHGFYNPARLHSALGYHSPNNYARQLRAAA